MNPSGSRLAHGPYPASDDAFQTGAALDQQLLTNRLIRQRGQAYHPGVVAPTPAASSLATGASAGPDTSALRATSKLNSTGAQMTQFGKPAAGGDDSAAAAVVRVPRPLQALLGNKLSLRAESEANGSPAAPAQQDNQGLLALLSRTGRLPTSKHALDTLQSGNKAYAEPANPYASASTAAAGGEPQGPEPPRIDIVTPGAASSAKPAADATSSSSAMASVAGGNGKKLDASALRERGNRDVQRPTAPAEVAGSLSAAERARRQDEYMRYLQSPFSFIDKVIESPFTQEFVYLNPKGPYSLQIVRHNQINPRNYCTMSRAGLTHFHNSETEFTSLDQWEREYFLYVKVTDIHFFKKFRAWKAYYFWKKLINKMKTTKYGKYLQDNLYILNKYLRDALIHLRRLCVDASRWNILKMDTKATQTILQFRAQQDQQREHVGLALNKLLAEATRVVIAACDNDLKQFLIECGFRKNKDDNSAGASAAAVVAVSAASSIAHGRGAAANLLAAVGGTGINAGGAVANPLIARDTYSYALGPAGGAGGPSGAGAGAGGDEGQKISRAEKAAQRTKCKKLARFIRLADFRVTYTMVTLCHDRVGEMLRALARKHTGPIPTVEVTEEAAGPGQGGAYPVGAAGKGHHSMFGQGAAAAAAAAKKKRAFGEGKNGGAGGDAPLFLVEIELDEQTGDLTFSPTLEELQHAVEQVIDSAATRLLSHQSFVRDEQFQEYVADILHELTELESQEVHPVELVLDDARMIRAKDAIRASLISAYAAIAEYTAGFQRYVAHFLENQAMNVESYRNAPVHVFSELLTRYEAQITSFQALRGTIDLGVLCVDSHRLRDTLIPSPKHCRTELARLLPAIAKQKCGDLVEELGAANAHFSRVPTDVAEFVEILVSMKNVTDSQEATNLRFVFIQEVYGLMQDAQIKVPEADKATVERLSQIRQQLKTTLMLTEASMQSNIDKFSKELEAQIPRLLDEVEVVSHALKHEMITSAAADKDTVIEYLLDQNSALNKIEATARQYQHFQETLGVEVSQYDRLRETRLDVNVKLDLWRSLKAWEEFTDVWTKKPFVSIDVDQVSQELGAFSKIYGRAKRQMDAAPAVDLLRGYIAEFANTLPMVSDLRNPHLLDRHWAEIHKLLGLQIQNDPDFNLGTLMQANAMEQSHAVSVVSIKARQEAVLQEQLNKVTMLWDQQIFPLLQYKNQKDMFILGNLDDILISLDESLVTLSSVLGSHYVEPLRKEATDVNHQLQHFQAVLDEWTLCQRQWMYLESIFTWQDIIRQLPDESAMFSQVSKAFVAIMRRTSDNPNCLASSSYAGLRDTLQNCNATLEKVNKQLESYLETKRIAFPRFYFLSNDELIAILSNQKNHQLVQPHLRKCFDNLVKLEFADKDIRAMISAEGEKVPLGVNLKVRNNVETWLGDLEKDMVKTLRRLMKKGLLEYDRAPRSTFILEKYAQVVMTVAQITWARSVDHALRSAAQDGGKALIKWHAQQLKQLSDLTAMVRGELANIDRKKVVTLITTDVHARDVTQTLIERKVRDTHDFNWQQQLRFYWDTNEDDCVIRQADARFLYGYEYMGVTSRLVITPLTDRCWITITGALHIRYGASPAGPAGTGKTESVKDLAKALGLFCVVFNCSEQINYKMMQKLFSGLAQTGAWSCLDEFNRIDIEVLSVVAQQVMQIRQALLQNQQVFTFQGQAIRLVRSCGVMITMNPGYAGRTELPDNLKVLFRPVAMMVPDYAMIAEIMLFSEGFESATILSKKMVQLYKLASEQLSQQDHYDFGMRAVKSVLVMAGALKRAEPDVDESTVLIRAMRDSNVPKFLTQDLPLFHAIVQDLFPDVRIPTLDYGALDGAIKQVVTEDGLQAVPKFVTKVVQLYDTFNVRFGVMLVGPAGGAKTACWRALARAMTLLRDEGSPDTTFQRVHADVMNPKAVSMGELYGDLNELSQEWRDGLASTIFREAIKDPSDDRHWVVFDGPVDALWIENMNTVLDDNMMLCLPTGERIKLKQELRVLFEVQDLSQASPATVSRCGMVYMTPSDMGVLPYVKSWLQTQTHVAAPVRDYLYAQFCDKLPLGLAFLQESGVSPIGCSELSSVVTMCRLLEQMLDPLSRAQQFIDHAEHQRVLDEQAQQAARERQNFASSSLPSAGTAPGETDASAAVIAAPAAAGSEEHKSSGDGAGSRRMSHAASAADLMLDAAASMASPQAPAGGLDGQLGGLPLAGTGANAQSANDGWCADLDSMKSVLDMAFAYAYAWGLGGHLAEEPQAQFCKVLNELFLHVKPPGTFFDVYVDLTERTWRSWDSLVTPFRYNAALPYFQILVPTTDTVKFRYLAQNLLSMSCPVFLTGLTGVGKTVVLQDMFDRLTYRSACISEKAYDPPVGSAVTGMFGSGDGGRLTSRERAELAGRFDVLPLAITFSARSSSLKTQEVIESRLIKVKATQLGAPHGRKLIVHVDDVNMPATEQYGAQPPIELLRQFLDYGGFYDRAGLFWKDVVNTTLLCSAAPPGGGRSAITPRFTRHFSVLSMPLPSDAVMKKIFSAIYTGWSVTNGFKGAIQKLNDSIVGSTIELYQSIAKELLPTPAKSHYTFNLRDISKVFQGILGIKPVSCSSPQTMTRLWIHECQRCFEDRLVNNADKLWCTQKIATLVQKNFGLDWRHDTLFKQQFITFCDFMTEGDKLYEEVKDSHKLVSVLESYLEQFNMSRSNAQMNLVFFEDAIKHLARISRVIRQPRGNAMLVGVGGSGKQSLTKLAAFISEYQCMTLEVTRNFSYADFQEFLKKVFIAAGVRGQNIVFLVSENQLIDERFLEDINNILNAGEVPNLFPKDELQKVLEDLTPVLREQEAAAAAAASGSSSGSAAGAATAGGASEGVDAAAAATAVSNPNALYNTFIQRVRDNLHVVLCLSPVGDSFRQRCRMFPSLINCTTIDWYMPWPRAALLSVAQVILQDMELDSDAVRAALATESVDIHLSVDEACERFRRQYRRNVYTTPKSYLDMLTLYMKMLRDLRTKLNNRRLHLLTGLKRLKDTKVMVGELSETLEKLKPTLLEKARETEALLQKVAVDSERADRVRAVVEVEEKEVAMQTSEVREEEASARANLELAMPALIAAEKAVGRLTKAQISEIKVMTSPPVQVTKVLEAVCILLNENPDWDTAKRVLANVNFVKMLKEYKKDQIDTKVIRRLNRYVTDPQLSQDKLFGISQPACAMMMWVQALHTYYHVNLEVAPKIKRVEELKTKLESAESRLRAKQDELADVVDNVRALQDRCKLTEAEKKNLDDKSRQTEARLERAQQLIDLLSGEEGRWSTDAENMQHNVGFLVGDAFIASACVSYYGAFTGEYRALLVQRWLAAARAAGIPVTDKFSLRECLGNPVDIRQWNINGLPTDDVSVDSAICTQHALRWPLMVDPQGQAKRWIKNDRRNKLHVARLTDRDLMKRLELCVRNGLTLLIEDVGETIDAVLDIVLNRQTFTHGGRTLMRIGESDVEYDSRFQLFMSTKLPNPHYLPEVCIKVTLLNFTVTREGLADQLLGEVVKKERSDVEDKKNRLVVSMAQDRKELANIEERILTMLQESQTLILDDIDLIQTLKESKATSQVIMDRVKQTHETQRDIEEIRGKYVPVATRGSILYFVISDLSTVDPMYQYSLDFFVRFFNMCIESSAPSPSLDQRIESLLGNITTSFFNNICRGLFERHKQLFAFSVMGGILRQAGLITAPEWSLLLRGPAQESLSAHGHTPSACPFPPTSISAEAWANVQRTEAQLPHLFSGLVAHMLANVAVWEKWISDPAVAKTAPPAPYDRVSPFGRLILVKSVRFDQVRAAVSTFIGSYPFGVPLMATPHTSITDAYKDSDHKTPIVFVLSTGADPTGLLLRLARDVDMAERLNTISLGQGQGDNARRLVDAAMRNGEWVLLQNCHLARSWMPELEALVESLDDEELHKVNPKFRLWLTSMPSEHFPVSVLQRGLKFTNEPPQGIRANLLRTYNNVLTPEDVQSGGKQAGTWRKLVFGLSFFHAIIQERKKFGPLGWNKMYEFNDSDLETSLTVLRNALEEHDTIPWDALRFITGQISYGGRVTDDWDRRCLMAILNKYYSPEILRDAYAFSPSGTYFAPPSTTAGGAAATLGSYVSYIQQLPALDDPEVFGMHDNANITYLNQEGELMLNTLLSMQPRDLESSTGKTSDDIVAELAQEIESKLPALLDRKEAGPTTFPAVEGEEEDLDDDPEAEPEYDAEGAIIKRKKPMTDDMLAASVDSMAEFLKQEIDRFNRLLTVVKTSLVDLQRAIKGQVVMSQDLDYMYGSLLNNRVPELWSRVAPPSLKNLASWVIDLHARIASVRDWLRNGKPASFWLSGFFFLQGFMTGVLQTHARRYRIPIDTISFSFKVMDVRDPVDLKFPAEDGVYIHGLFTTGATWSDDAQGLVDSPVGELISPMPVIHFLPRENYSKADQDYACPIYKTAVRAGVLSTTGQSTNFVVDVHLPSEQDPTYWVLKGVAILCQPDSA